MEGLMKDITNKTIIVTGGAGLIGAHLVEELINRKAKVIVPYVEILSQAKFAQDKLSEKVTLEKIDITNKKLVYQLIQKYQPEYIFHLAAETIVTKAYENPVQTLDTNIMGTVYLLEAVRQNPSVKGLIFASSDKAYGKTTTTYTEDYPLKGDHPYDVSKSCGDLIAQMYFNTYQTPVVVARFGNVYGEGDIHFNRIIPGICESLITQKPLDIRSDGTFVRDYIYVKDVVNGYLVLMEQLEGIKGEAFNFSSEDTLSVLDVIKKSEKILNIKINYNIRNVAKNEIPYQHLNDEKVRKLGWKASYSLESSLPQVFEWYRRLLHK